MITHFYLCLIIKAIPTHCRKLFVHIYAGMYNYMYTYTRWMYNINTIWGCALALGGSQFRWSIVSDFICTSIRSRGHKPWGEIESEGWRPNKHSGILGLAVSRDVNWASCDRCMESATKKLEDSLSFAMHTRRMVWSPEDFIWSCMWTPWGEGVLDFVSSVPGAKWVLKCFWMHFLYIAFLSMFSEESDAPALRKAETFTK